MLEEIGRDRRLRQAELHSQRDQMLLGAVVDVAFEAAPLFVLRGHDPLPRGAELGRLHRDLVQAGLEVGGQPGVRQDQPGLVGEAVDELGLAVRERLARSFVHGDRAE
jgi:hypothetical protein